MHTRMTLCRHCGAAALAACILLAGSPAGAAGKPFPLGSYTAEGHELTIAFDDKGQFRVTEAGALRVTGQYAAHGGQLEISDAQGPWACTKVGERTGTYRWRYENSVLAFSKVTDSCVDRVQSLTSAHWKAKT